MDLQIGGLTRIKTLRLEMFRMKLALRLSFKRMSSQVYGRTPAKETREENCDPSELTSNIQSMRSRKRHWKRRALI